MSTSFAVRKAIYAALIALTVAATIAPAAPAAAKSADLTDTTISDQQLPGLAEARKAAVAYWQAVPGVRTLQQACGVTALPSPKLATTPEADRTAEAWGTPCSGWGKPDGGIWLEQGFIDSLSDLPSRAMRGQRLCMVLAHETGHLLDVVPGDDDPTTPEIEGDDHSFTGDPNLVMGFTKGIAAPCLAAFPGDGFGSQDFGAALTRRQAQRAVHRMLARRRHWGAPWRLSIDGWSDVNGIVDEVIVKARRCRIRKHRYWTRNYVVTRPLVDGPLHVSRGH